MADLRMLIDGTLVDSDTTLDVVVNPADRTIFRVVPRADATHVGQAVAAAKRAFNGWRDTPLEERRARVCALADAIDARRQDFADALVGEQGKPLSQALDEVDWTTGFLPGYAAIDLPVDVVDAIDDINSSPFGLGGSVWSADAERAYAVAQRLDTGTVWINHHLHLHPMVPVGGAKESGNGVDYGVEGLKQYTQTTVIRLPK